MTVPYTNRELDMKFKVLEDNMLANHEETLEKISESDRKNHDKHMEVLNFLSEIKTETKKTNGGVTSLKLSRAWMTGVIAVIIVIVLPLVVYVFTTQYNVLQGQITEIKSAK